jgi:uncharacterized protein (UPF0548 family)
LFLARKPTSSLVSQFLAEQATSQFSYSSVGASLRDELPSGFAIDHNRIQLGQGETAWRRAQDALLKWKMFDLGWVELTASEPSVVRDLNVAVLVHHLGFWSLNGARVVGLTDKPGQVGFAYGTLSDHAESGEERFIVERHADGTVWYDLLAFSRPRSFAAIVGYPISRSLQRRFARDSLQAMMRAVAD